MDGGRRRSGGAGRNPLDGARDGSRERPGWAPGTHLRRPVPGPRGRQPPGRRAARPEPLHGRGSQNFSFDSGSLYEQQVNTFTGKCWDVPGNSHQYGVIQYYCNGASNQRFRFVPTGAGRYEIRTNLGWCLTAIDGNVPGARLHLYPCTGESIQQFYVS